jgi:aldehyde dehydrogenase (NAD+)
MALARALADAGLPPGVLNLVLGGTAELGRSLVEDPDIVFVVAGDCDVRRAAEVACESAFGESGQKCTASGLVVVDARRGDRFLSEIETILAGLAMGDGADPGIDLGPLVDLAAVDRAGILVDEAVEPGATIELSGCGGRPPAVTATSSLPGLCAFPAETAR